MYPMRRPEACEAERPLRKRSEYGYYHVMIRGNGKQIIFEVRDDYIYFLNLLKLVVLFGGYKAAEA